MRRYMITAQLILDTGDGFKQSPPYTMVLSSPCGEELLKKAHAKAYENIGHYLDCESDDAKLAILLLEELT